MTNLRHLIVDLRAHAHEVPEPIGALMRAAAAALDGEVTISGRDHFDIQVGPPPFPPPTLEEADAQG